MIGTWMLAGSAFLGIVGGIVDGNYYGAWWAFVALVVAAAFNHIDKQNRELLARNGHLRDKLAEYAVGKQNFKEEG